MKRKQLRAWVSLAEIISAVAIVVSLIYVGIEIDRSTSQSDSDVYDELLLHTVRRRLLIIESAELADIIVRGSANFGDLNEADKLRFLNYSELLFVAWERAWAAYDGGVLTEELWLGWNDFFALKAGENPPFVWEEVRGTWDAALPFQAHVDKTLDFKE